MSKHKKMCKNYQDFLCGCLVSLLCKHIWPAPQKYWCSISGPTCKYPYQVYLVPLFDLISICSNTDKNLMHKLTCDRHPCCWLKPLTLSMRRCHGWDCWLFSTSCHVSHGPVSCCNSTAGWTLGFSLSLSLSVPPSLSAQVVDGKGDIFFPVVLQLFHFGSATAHLAARFVSNAEQHVCVLVSGSIKSVI